MDSLTSSQVSDIREICRSTLRSLPNNQFSEKFLLHMIDRAIHPYMARQLFKTVDAFRTGTEYRKYISSIKRTCYTIAKDEIGRHARIITVE